MKPLTRRNLLLSLLGLSALSGGGLAWHNARRSAADPVLFVADLMRRRFAYLKITAEDLARFAAEYVDRAGSRELRQLQQLAAAERGVLEGLFPFLRRREAVVQSFERRQLERRIAARFLLATDFYSRDDAGETPRSVRYVAYPDPYETGCANPFVG